MHIPPKVELNLFTWMKVFQNLNARKAGRKVVLGLCPYIVDIFHKLKGRRNKVKGQNWALSKADSSFQPCIYINRVNKHTLYPNTISA